MLFAFCRGGGKPTDGCIAQQAGGRSGNPLRPRRPDVAVAVERGRAPGSRRVDRAPAGRRPHAKGGVCLAVRHHPRGQVQRGGGRRLHPAAVGLQVDRLRSERPGVSGSIRERFLGEEALFASPYAGPMVDRSRKGDYGVAGGGDRLIALKSDRLRSAPTTEVMPNAKPQGPSLAQQQPAEPLSLDPSVDTAKPAGEPTEQPASPRPAEGTPTDKSADGAAGGATAVRSVGNLAFAGADVDPSLRAARLYFSIDPMGQKLCAIEPWTPGEEPRFQEAEIAASNNANVKLAAVPPVPFPAGEPGSIFDAPVERADLPPLPSDPGVVMKNGIGGGQTVAPKGEVTGQDQRPMTPAERLGLDEASRAKSEKCLAEAIYFESRGEAVRGQMAVAQVILNRVFS